MKKMSLFAALTLLSMVLMGCNTVAGAGKDIQKAGDKIEGAAKG